MDIYCVVTGQDERGKSVLVQKKPIEPVRLAQFRVRFFRSRFTGQRNGSFRPFGRNPCRRGLLERPTPNP
jgi:hypothetical protein